MSHASRWLLLSLPLTAACGDDEAVAALDDRVAALEAAKSDDDAALAALQGQVTALAGRVDAAEASLAALGAVDVSDLQADLDALDAELATAQTTLGTHAGQIGGLSTTATAIQGSISTHGAQIAGLNSSISSLQSTVTGHTTGIGALGADLSAIETDLASFETDLASVQTDLASVQTDLASVQTDLDDLGEGVVRRQTGALTLNVPSQYPTIQAALDALDGLQLEQTATIRLAAGNHTGSILVDHPNGDQIRIVGATGNLADVTYTVSSIGAAVTVPAGKALGRMEDLTLVGTAGTALQVHQDARAMLVDVRITGFSTGVNVSGGYVSALRVDVDDVSTGFSVRDAGTLFVEDVTLFDTTGSAILADMNSLVFAYDVDATQSFVGYTLRAGSVLTGTNVSATDPTNYGFELESGAVLVGSNFTAEQAVFGFTLTQSVARMIGLHANDNTADGVIANAGSSFTLWGGTPSTVTGNGRDGLAAWGGSYLDAGSTKPSGSGGYEARALSGSWIQAQWTGLVAGDVYPRVTDSTAYTAAFLP